MPRSYGRAWDYAIFSFLKNLYTDFHGGGINLYSTNYVYKLLIHYLTEFIFLAILMIAILTKVRWNIDQVLNLHFSDANDSERFFFHIY